MWYLVIIGKIISFEQLGASYGGIQRQCKFLWFTKGLIWFTNSG
jgi:hypothetical protein